MVAGTLKRAIVPVAPRSAVAVGVGAGWLVGVCVGVEVGVGLAVGVGVGLGVGVGVASVLVTTYAAPRSLSARYVEAASVAPEMPTAQPAESPAVSFSVSVALTQPAAGFVNT